jgi:hypothetical protein
MIWVGFNVLMTSINLSETFMVVNTAPRVYVFFFSATTTDSKSYWFSRVQITDMPGNFGNSSRVPD